MSDTRHEWLYLSTGTVTHHVNRDNLAVAADCGTRPPGFWPTHDDWRGTGTQNEYERAAALPRCRRCTHLLAGRRVGDRFEAG